MRGRRTARQAFAARRDGVSARFSAAQAGIIRNLVTQVAELIGGEGDEAGTVWQSVIGPVGTAPAGPGQSAPGQSAPGQSAPGQSAPGQSAPGQPGEPSGAEDLAASPARAGPPPAGDPVLARLLPDAYRDDPAAAGEFRKYTEPDLRSGKVAAAQTVLSTLPAAGRPGAAGTGRGPGLARALNDVRLAIGMRLGVTEDDRGRDGPGPTGRTPVRPILRCITGWESPGLAGPRAVVSQAPATLSSHADDHRRAVRQDRGARPRRPSGRGMRGHRRPGRERPPGAVHPDAQRRAVADLLPVRLDGAVRRLAGDGRAGRGTGGDLPLAHRHQAYPSRTDIAYASEPGAHYVLVSTREPDRAEFRSFRIVDGVVTEEEVRVAASVGGPGAGMIPLGQPVLDPGDDSTRPRHDGMHTGATFMAIEVRIPTILRTYTGRREVGRGFWRHARRAAQRH